MSNKTKILSLLFLLTLLLGQSGYAFACSKENSIDNLLNYIYYSVEVVNELELIDGNIIKL
jgi:hypothetical protein